ncbi:MAG: alpha/beta hydrolase [Nitrospirae bacterium]|nr:alpha/beta hydrolase [Nitrospirota bacterium]
MLRNNKTIVMIHGMMAGPWCWEDYRNFFEAKGYRCVTPSLRYHDMDPVDAPHPQLGITGIQDYIEDLEKEILKLDTPPIIMGHSMGGLLAQILVSRNLVESAVLLCPAPPHGVIALKPSAVRCFSDVLMTWGFWRKPFRFSFKKTVYSCLHLMPEKDQKEAYDKLVYESGRAAFEIGLWFLDNKKATKVHPEDVKCPLLVITGKEDRIIPASVVKKVADRYMGVSTYKEFTNHAHWVIGEPGWEDIADYIYEWLGENVD